MNRDLVDWYVWRLARRHIPFPPAPIEARTRFDEDLKAFGEERSRIARHLSDLFCFPITPPGLGAFRTIGDVSAWLARKVNERGLDRSADAPIAVTDSVTASERAVQIVGTLRHAEADIDALLHELAALGSPAGRTTRYLVLLLNDPDPEARRRAAVAAGSLGPTVRGAQHMLRARLTDPRETSEVRMALRSAVFRVTHGQAGDALNAVDCELAARGAGHGHRGYLGRFAFDGLMGIIEHGAGLIESEAWIGTDLLGDHISLIPWRPADAIRWLDVEGREIPNEWADWAPVDRDGPVRTLLRGLAAQQPLARMKAAAALARLCPGDPRARTALIDATERERDPLARSALRKVRDYLHGELGNRATGRYISDARVLVEFAGDFSQQDAGHSVVDELQALAPREVLLDLNAVDSGATAFLSVIASLHQHLTRVGSRTAYALHAGPLLRNLEADGFTKVLAIRPTRQEAMALLDAGSGSAGLEGRDQA